MKKMKFSLLSGAYINAGDFLIVNRTKELLRKTFPNCEIIEYKRNRKLDFHIDEVNKTDALIIAGGPAYTIDMYPDTLPLVDDLNKITTKIVTIGLGWYGKNTTDKFLYNYRFSEKAKELLDRIVIDSKYLSCRDWYSVKVLFLNGYNSAILTGCPAWYNIEKLKNSDLKNYIDYNFAKICISDPADFINIKESLLLAKIIKDKFPLSQLFFVFHRVEVQGRKYTWLINKLSEMDIHIIDITGDDKKFAVYDDCDLHIGYRVHAHIYNLSQRNISILIEEDGRGSGVNESLGLLGIKAFNSSKIKTNNNGFMSKILSGLTKIIIAKKEYSNNNFVKEIDNYLEIIKTNNYSQYKTAFYNIQLYNKKMEDYLIKVFKEGE